MVKSGTWQTTAEPWGRVPGWVPDSTHPAMIDADRISVVGSGTVVLTAQATNQTGAWAYGRIRVMHNGILVGGEHDIGSGATVTITETITVADGDFIEMQGRRGANFSHFLNMTAGFVDITPA